MASIRKRGDLQWQAEIRKKGFDPQRKTFNTKAEAEAWAKVTEAEMIRGVFVDRSEAESTSLKEALDRYLKEVTPRKKGAIREEQRIRAWMMHPLAIRMLAAIRGADLAKFRDEQRKLGKSDATIRLNLVIISHLFEIARREWGMESLVNPCRNIVMPKGSKQRDRRLEEGEEERFFAALDQHCRNPYIPALIRFSIETAGRRGELIKLKWEDVDKKKQTARIIDGKNGEDRTIPLSSRAIEILENLPRHLSGKVFPVSADAVTRAVTAARRKAGIQDLRFHDLRHEATSRLFEKGLNQMEAASITGHKTLQMLKRYTHLKAEDLAKKLG